MASFQNSPKGLFFKDQIGVTEGVLFEDYSSSLELLRASTTGVIVRGGVKVSNKANAIITGNATGIVLNGGLKLNNVAALSANSTALSLPGGLKLSGKSTAIVTANTTAVIVSALRVGTKATYFTSDSTGIKLGSRYVSTNTTGNSAT